MDSYCTTVNYYKRYTGIKGFSLKLPYIVKSRANKKLKENLVADDYPILLEGIHSTYFLFSGLLKNRKTFVRLHNVEHEYYYQLGKNENSFFKRLFYFNESRLLQQYEKAISGKAQLLSITEKDAADFKELFGATDVRYLPAFLHSRQITGKEGRGNYCLYHGNLSVAENEKAAVWLSENIFNELNIPFIVAGKNPSEKLIQIMQQCKNGSVIRDPGGEEMNDLISNAQVNIIPSFNTVGIKIKLLNALFTGRHCVVNKAAVDGNGLGSFCTIAETMDEFKSAIQSLFNEPFTQYEIEKRKLVLLKEFDNTANAERLMQWIY